MGGGDVVIDAAWELVVVLAYAGLRRFGGFNRRVPSAAWSYQFC